MGVTAHREPSGAQPGLHALQPFGRTGGREAGEVTLVAQGLELEAEAVHRRRRGAQPRLGGGADQEPHGTLVQQLGELVEAVEVDVAGGDREGVLGVDVVDQVGERRAVAVLVVEVVEQLRPAHAPGPANRSRTAPR